MAELTYYVNGAWVPAAQAALPLDDLGIVRGFAIFDLLRTYGHTPFRLQDHLRRLESSAQQIGLMLPWSLAELEQIVLEANRRNGLADVAIRILVTGGSSSSFLMPQGRPSLVVMVHPITPYPDSYYRDGCKAITTLIERTMPTVKSTNYIGAIMAVTEAAKVQAVEAIYLDAHDRLTEGTRANLFVFRDRRLITPREGILKGITRQVVMEVAADEFDVVEHPVTYQELGSVDEAFLTSTTKEVLPIVQIDDQRIGTGRVGPHTLRVMDLFRTYVASVAAPLAM